MDSVITNIFIQARMSSSRFPGKILAPLNGKPILKHVIDSVCKVKNNGNFFVLTSSDESDDPVACYLESIDCPYFRGPLDNVFNRFQLALGSFPCDYFIRLSADSPFINSKLIEFMIEKCTNNEYDLVSNVVSRTFPKGQSVEIIRSEAFLIVDQLLLTKEEIEHVFPYFYRNQNDYKICGVENTIDESNLNYCVDTLDDYQRLSFIGQPYQFIRENVC